ncbi:MAG: AMP-binding protein [Halioglobus sp.]
MPSSDYHHAPPEAVEAFSTSVGHVFSETAKNYSASMAVEDGETSFTYGELDERVNRLCNLMLEAGLKPQQRIAIITRNSITYLEIILAASKIGVIASCQNWRLTPPELEYCIDLVAPTLIFLSPEFEHLLTKKVSDDIQTALIDGDYEKKLLHQPASAPMLAASPESGFIILYTSGTTGHPKGALISHRASLARTMVYASELNVPIDDTFIAWSPLFHIGSADHSIATLLRGGKVFVVDGFDTDLILHALEHNRTQWLSVLPGITDRLIDVMKKQKPNLIGVGCVGGMPDLISPAQIAEISSLFQAPYLDSFGSTETGISPATGSLIPIGVTPEKLTKRQTIGCEVRLVDEFDQEVPDGTPGEVAVRGPVLFSGYVNNAKANEACFRGGWYHMGDVMLRTPETRTLQFMDRLKYLIKSGGENIYPAEIERVLLADPRVDEAAVVRRPDEKWGEVPIAFVARKDKSLRENDILALCVDVLARYKHPKAVMFIARDEFPRGATGKVKREELEKRISTI